MYSLFIHVLIYILFYFFLLFLILFLFISFIYLLFIYLFILLFYLSVCCPYALEIFCHVDCVTLHTVLAGDDVTSSDVVPT